MRCRVEIHRYLNMLPSLAPTLGCRVLLQVLISKMSTWACTKFLLDGLLWFPFWLKGNSRSAVQLYESSSIKAVFFPFRELIHPKIPCQLSFNTALTQSSLLGGKMGSGSYHFDVESCVCAHTLMTMITYFCVVIGQNLKLCSILKEKVFFLFTECKLCVRLCWKTRAGCYLWWQSSPFLAMLHFLQGLSSS